VLSTIAHWRTRYRVAAGGAAVERLERAVRERAAESYAAALEEVFGADPAVYVLRRVETELTLVNAADEMSVARKWGERTCAAVVRTVMRHGDDPSLVMRFEDTSAYIAQWIADLLDGVAWERWYYSAFARYRSLSVDGAVRAVLLENREHLAAILRRLGVRRRLPALLSRVSRQSARELWHTAMPPEARTASREELRVFVRTAFAIADALELWRDGIRPNEGNEFDAYCATSPRPSDWKETHALAEAVFAVMLFLQRRELVGVTGTVAPPARVQDAVATFEWFDRTWLSAAVEAWLRGAAGADEFTPARPPELTALQRRIVDVLQKLLASGAVTLPDAEPASERNALALFGALATAEPLLAAHAAAPAAIDWVLQQRTATSSASGTGARIARARGESIESAFAGLFLLTRVVVETRLVQLADAYGENVADVLLGLAEEWECDVEDPGVLLWSGGAPRQPAHAPALHAEIVRLMRDRAAFAPSLMPDEAATTGVHLMRLWAHWLPGLGHSSAPWLLRQFILRGGVVTIDDAQIAVALRPAPLDVVLELAHYLDPISAVPWLGDRRVTFTIDRSLA
jgi:hypothetical protein